jgi:hypothetical protein
VRLNMEDPLGRVELGAPESTIRPFAIILWWCVSSFRLP